MHTSKLRDGKRTMTKKMGKTKSAIGKGECTFELTSYTNTDMIIFYFQALSPLFTCPSVVVTGLAVSMKVFNTELRACKLHTTNIIVGILPLPVDMGEKSWPFVIVTSILST